MALYGEIFLVSTSHLFLQNRYTNIVVGNMGLILARISTEASMTGINLQAMNLSRFL